MIEYLLRTVFSKTGGQADAGTPKGEHRYEEKEEYCGKDYRMHSSGRCSCGSRGLPAVSECSKSYFLSRRCTEDRSG
jgi:hypothetical protein